MDYLSVFQIQSGDMTGQYFFRISSEPINEAAENVAIIFCLKQESREKSLDSLIKEAQRRCRELGIEPYKLFKSTM